MDNMKTSVYKKDMNRVEISGEVRNLPEFARFVQLEGQVKTLISFDLFSYRKRKSEQSEFEWDDIKIVIFNDENIINEVQEGDRYKFTGELQSRNYNRVEEEIDELWGMAVHNYHVATGQYPCEEQPCERKKQPIDWRKLLQIGLIPEAPEDSMYDADMKKSKSPETPYIYRVDLNGEVTKETQHVTYEVLVNDYEKLEEAVHPLNGDINKVQICGRVTRNPFFNFLGREKPVAFVNFNVGSKSELFSNHMFFNNAIAWGKNAEKIMENINEGDFVYFKGRLQSREYIKKMRKRWTTPGGNRKKKDIEIPLKTREVSISYIEKCTKEKKA